ncbi:MAG TPA: multidrug effflux MFS transporter [Parachlamydiaceae bacterium]|nr:multidrug effflux MFS transporter [Parachlamydiaceae bacterium]
MKHYNTKQLVLILTPFVFSFAFGLDIYIPIVPRMSEIFNVSPGLIQLTLSLFLLATGVGQLLIGPLSDQLGRKKVFYASSFFFMAGSLLCAFSSSIFSLLLMGRLISACGACGMLVTAFALVRDLYAGDENAKIYSFLNGAIGISPTFAPIIGGYLSYYFGWQSIFIFLSFIGLSALFMVKFYIQETLKEEDRIKLDAGLLKRYITIFSNRQFLIYGLIGGLAESVFFCFFSISPFMIIELHGIPEHQFGYYFAVFGSVISLGGFLGGKITEKFGVRKTILSGISLIFFGGTLMFCWDCVHLSLTGFLLPMAIACTGAMFLVGATVSLALEPFSSMAGTASAAFGALEFGMASIAGSLLMLFPVVSSMSYAISLILLSSLSFLLFVKRPGKIKV